MTGTTKYSRQREAILSYLHSTTAHPTAETVYHEVRKDYPKISLGTVYRNLNFLSEKGLALKLNCGDGFDRFDGNPAPHYHFVCTDCGCVIDIDLPSTDDLIPLASSNFKGQIHGQMTYFYGKCPNCIKDD